MRINKDGEKKNEGLRNINSLFDKYKKILIAPEKTTISTFIEVVEDLYGWKISDEIVSYSPNSKTISVSGSGVLKSELQLNKKEILTHLKGRLGTKSCPKDIF